MEITQISGKDLGGEELLLPDMGDHKRRKQLLLGKVRSDEGLLWVLMYTQFKKFKLAKSRIILSGLRFSVDWYRCLLLLIIQFPAPKTPFVQDLLKGVVHLASLILSLLQAQL